MSLNAQRELRETRGGPALACLGKSRFEPQQRSLAAKVAQRMAKQRHSRISVFRCPHCGGWHVGNDLG